MKILDRYISRTVLSTILLVTLVLIGFQVFILFVNELDDLGRGQYHLSTALPVVLLQVPGEVYLFFPVACLIGVLIGLGQLASNRELVVMQTAGISVRRIAWSVMRAAILLILLVTALGELFSPQLLQLANEKRWAAISNGQAMQTNQGVWFKHQNDFIVIENSTSDRILKQVHQFHFDDNQQLLYARKIAKIQRDTTTQKWEAFNIEESAFEKDYVKTRTIERMDWLIPMDMVSLRFSKDMPDELSFLELRAYVKSKTPSSLFYQHKLAYWQRLLQPLATAVMMMLAIPFIFGPLRSSTMGAKLLMGVAVGFGFYLIGRFFGPLAEILRWPPELAASLPTGVFALLGMYWMGRVRFK